MITSDQLANLIIRRVIFHDVPVQTRYSPDVRPTLADIETEIDGPRREHLRTRLTRVLGSKTAYPVTFDVATPSVVPRAVREYTQLTSASPTAVGPAEIISGFVERSRSVAEQLFLTQNGANSPGLLCVLDVSSGALTGLVLMKLERQAGAQLELTGVAGRRSFNMSVLDNLVLTDGTRLFKAAIFLRRSEDDDDFDSAACDEQMGTPNGNAGAQFWLRFLGCVPTEDPRLATQRFYDATLRFINDDVDSPSDKNDLYEHLHSTLKGPRHNVSPRSFIDSFVPTRLRPALRSRYEAEGVALVTFAKDNTDIDGRIRRLAYRTVRGAVVTVPADRSEIVTIGSEEIVVADTLDSVGRG